MEHIINVVILLAVLAMAAQWVAWRIRLPAIVLLAVAGILVGPVFNLMNPMRDFPTFSHVYIELCVALILFEGGMNLRWHEFKANAGGMLRLVIPAVVLCFIFGTLAAHFIGQLSWQVSSVLGAIIIVTGPTVIIPLLRSARMKQNVSAYLKWEGIVNDPVGAVLAVIAFQYVVYEFGQGWSVFIKLPLVFIYTIAIAYGFSRFMKWVLSKGLIPEFLKPTMLLVSALAVFAMGNIFQTQGGLLSATFYGIFLTNSGLPDILRLRRFKEHLTVLLVSTVFILISSTIDFNQIELLKWNHLLLLLAVLFVVRPAAILISTIGSKMSFSERLLIAWVSPRGIVAAAVAGIFGPALVDAGYADAQVFVPFVFALIMVTVLVHGLSLNAVAKLLKLSASAENGVIIVGANVWTIDLAKVLQTQEVKVLMVDHSWGQLRNARLENIQTYYGEILSEIAEQDLDTSEYSYLLAASYNEAYNALVCNHFNAELGQSNVYQLRVEESGKGAQVAHTLRGHALGDENYILDVLVGYHYRGWWVKATTFTENYSFEDFDAELQSLYMPILLIDKKKNIQFYSEEHKLAPQAGDTLIAFMSGEVARK